MNQAYITSEFELHERHKNWDALYEKIELKSDEDAVTFNLSVDAANDETNFDRNRYRNVLPYDYNRVKLNITNSTNNDYINASLLSMPFVSNKYILTQGPLSNTVDDFWQMIFEQNVLLIVMLNRLFESGISKGHPYFPTADKPMIKTQLFTLEHVNEQVENNFVVRSIVLTQHLTNQSINHKLQKRVIYHFQYLDWPDFHVPEKTQFFLEFLSAVQSKRDLLHRAFSPDVSPPIVCHCSAGIGRTGTFLVADVIVYMFLQAKISSNSTTDGIGINQNSSIEDQHQFIYLQDSITLYSENNERIDSIEGLIIFLRRYRMGLIQTPEQLRFCWMAIHDWLFQNKDGILKTKDSEQSLPTTEEIVLEIKKENQTSKQITVNNNLQNGGSEKILRERRPGCGPDRTNKKSPIIKRTRLERSKKKSVYSQESKSRRNAYQNA